MSKTSAPGLIVAAPASGSGKTLVTQAVLRALKNSGKSVFSAKTGPDYIDPHFHKQASGQECLNLDSWAMRPGVLQHLIACLSKNAEIIICEGVMGLFDGASVDDEKADGSTASLARLTGWPVVLVVDASKQAASIAALIRGFVSHSSDVEIAGIIFNQVGSPAHEDILRKACTKHLPNLKILGALRREPKLVLPERHLGLVQAQEHENLDAFLNSAANWLTRGVDIERLADIARPAKQGATNPVSVQIEPLGSHIAIADDAAFGFSYPSLIAGWRSAGAELSFFSPLQGEAPSPEATAVYLPGGYPELHAGTLSSNGFLEGLKNAASRDTFIYGECGGFMVLGQGLVDADGTRHQMAGLLPVETSFEAPKLHLGYRQVLPQVDLPFASSGNSLRGHEFHYASITTPDEQAPLFEALNATGADLGHMGSCRKQVAGSFIHLIDQI